MREIQKQLEAVIKDIVAKSVESLRKKPRKSGLIGR